jgi:cephalosporin hydroxylase
MCGCGRTLPEIYRRGEALGLAQHEAEFLPFLEWVFLRHPHGVIEIGTLYGGTLSCLAEVSTGPVLSIDLPGGPWGGDAHHLDMERMVARNTRLANGMEPGRFHGYLGPSASAGAQDFVRRSLNTHGDAYVDLLFIDGDHSLRGVRTDYEFYRRFVRKGGVIAFHDIADTPLHTTNAVAVPAFWRGLDWAGEKFEWHARADYGGIGALVMP